MRRAVYGDFCEGEAGARFTGRNSLRDGNGTASRPGLRPRYSRLGNKSAASWFTSAASALLQHKDSRGGLWGFEIPSNLLTFIKQDSIPCGVMVVLDMIAEIDTPK